MEGFLTLQPWRENLPGLSPPARRLRAAGVGLNAGHDLTVANLPPLVAALPNLQEVSIGHAVIADAMEFGMEGAVKRFRVAIGDL